MTFREAEDFLLGRELFGWKLGLERMHRFLAELGNPHEQFASIHVAGTNGKGSVTAMTDAILRRAGLKVGRYTSPHLVSLRERMRIDGMAIPEERVCDLVARYRDVIVALECTFFETMTGLAFRYFADQHADIAVVEVGLGGRLDATNVIKPLVSVITNLSFDHTDHLGNTMKAIAGEKAGIIKPGIPCIMGVLPEEGRVVVADRCAELDSPLFEARKYVYIDQLKFTDEGTFFGARTPLYNYPELFLPLPGPHQAANARIAVVVAELLVSSGVCQHPLPVKEGFADVTWPGRFSKVKTRPIIILDVAHNAGGMQKLGWMLRRFYGDRRIFLVIGLMKDKAIEDILQRLPRNLQRIFAVPAPTHRTLPAPDLATAMTKHGLQPQICTTVAEGIAAARAAAGNEDVICITGSHYVVGEALSGIKHLTI